MIISFIKSAVISLASASLLVLPATAVVAETGTPQSAADTSVADPHAAHRAMLKKSSAADTESSSDVTLHDKLLTTRNGDAVLFATDVVRERIVVIDFVYTTCTTICPVLSAILQQVQEGLGDRLGDDVGLISISVDPVRDTPQRLKAYAEQLRAQPEWVWLTGQKSSVDDVLVGLGAYTPDFADHPSIVLVGDPQSGTWKRYFGFPGPNKILAAVDELIAARQVAHARP